MTAPLQGACRFAAGDTGGALALGWYVSRFQRFCRFAARDMLAGGKALQQRAFAPQSVDVVNDSLDKEGVVAVFGHIDEASDAGDFIDVDEFIAGDAHDAHGHFAGDEFDAELACLFDQFG